MNAYSIGLYEKAMPDALSWPQKLQCAKECGYHFVEISIDESDLRLARLMWSKTERLALVQAMYETGVPIRSMCLSAHRKYPLGAKDPAVRQRGMEIMAQAIELADDLGIRTIQLAGYDAYYPQDQWAESERFFSQNLKKATAMAAVKGIAMGFETMETPFMNTVAKSMVYVAQNDSPWLGVYPDCGNLTNAATTDISVVQDLNCGTGKLIAMHLKATKPGIFRNMYFDSPDQHVDFASCIETAWKLGVRRFVTELWYLGSDEWMDDVKTANHLMRHLLDHQASQDFEKF